MSKKKFKETKFGEFITKAGQLVPEILTVGGKILTGNVGGAIDEISNILDSKKEESADIMALKLEFERNKNLFESEILRLEIEDRKSARELYKEDDIAQKILAALFTIAYFGISYVLINHFFTDESRLEDYELGFMSTLFGAMSSKVNTIIDFFFGGSMKK